MARRREAQKRKITPDPKFNDLLVARFINCILNKGKKGLAETIFYKALENIESKGKEEPLRVFRKAIENAAPLLEVRSRRVGGATYQVPIEVFGKIFISNFIIFFKSRINYFRYFIIII